MNKIVRAQVPFINKKKRIEIVYKRFISLINGTWMVTENSRRKKCDRFKRLRIYCMFDI